MTEKTIIAMNVLGALIREPTQIRSRLQGLGRYDSFTNFKETAVEMAYEYAEELLKQAQKTSATVDQPNINE